MREVKSRGGILIAAALLTAWGCGDGTPRVSSSSAEVKVTGTVKIKGKPATGGRVTFNPSNVRRKDAPVKSAEIKPDGTFEVTTLVGENMITVTGPEVATDPKLAMNQKMIDIKGAGPVDIDVP